MKRLSLILLALAIPLIFSPGCGSSSPTTPSSPPVAIEFLNGQSGIAVTSTFSYTFSRAAAPSTVNTGTTMIIQAPCSDVTCVQGYASTVPTTPTLSSSNLDLTLTPSSNLAYDATHCACIVGVQDASGTTFSTVEAEFTTAAQSTSGITSVTDAAGKYLGETGSVGVNPSSFAITFSSTFTANIALTCGSLTPTTAVAVVGNIHTVTVTDAWQYANMSCSLAITGTGFTNKTYTFTNGCAVNDDFNGDSQACWPVDGIWLSGTTMTWANLLSNGLLAFDTSNSYLTVNFTGDAGESLNLRKTVSSLDNSVFEIEIYFPSVSNFTNGALTQIQVFITDTTNWYMTGIRGDGVQSCYAYADNGAAQSAYSTPCPSGAGYYLKLARAADGTFTRQYRTVAGAYAELTFDPASAAWPDITFAGTIYFGIRTGGANGNEQAQIGHVQTTGITVSGQY